MDRKKIISLIAGGSLLLVSVFGAVTYRVVNAQATTGTPAPNTATQPLPGHGNGMGGYTDAELATALGITTAQLQTGEQTATADALKQAVAAGLITQAQADQYASNSGTGKPMGGMPWLNNSAIDTNALLAKALGISTDALKAAQQKAYDSALSQAVQNGTMTQDQADLAKASYLLANNAAFQAAQKAGFETAVKQAVTDGLITQAQADLVLKNNNGTGTLRSGDHGGPGGFLPGIPPVASSSTTTTKTDFISLLAKALGISTDQFQTAYQQAYNTSLDQAVQNGTMTQDQADLSKASYALENNAKFQAALKDTFAAAVKQAVTDGTITQAQADLITKNSNGTSLPGTGIGGGHGGFGGRGGPGGPGGNPLANPINP